MKRLLGVELTRLRLRRAVVMLVVAAVVIPLLIFAGLAWDTRPIGADDRRDAEREAAELAQQPFVLEEIQNCINRPRDYGIRDPANAEARCPERVGVSPENFLFRPELDIADERAGSGIAVISLLVALTMLIGTTFAGHDWNSGSMSNQLLFEPRRLRVYAAKATAVFVLALITGAVVLAAYWGALWVLAETRDLTVAEGVWRRVLGTVWRGDLMIALAAVAGYALTMLFRSTVATLSIMAGVGIAGSVVTLAVLGEDGQRWLLPVNALAVLQKGYQLRIFDEQSCERTQGRVCERFILVSQYDGALVLGGLAVLAVLLSLWTFQRRDVP